MGERVHFEMRAWRTREKQASLSVSWHVCERAYMFWYERADVDVSGIGGRALMCERLQ